tara:strand:- start:237 stop:689 length:453 start_codon:yes stop_codon:yes gene_type:complete
MKMKISSLKDLKKFANIVSKLIIPGDHIFMYGEIGVGKTTFAKFLINNIELKNKLKKSEVISPTFNILFEYNINNFTIKHYDLYRLKNEDEIKNIGLFENLDRIITIIEWPEMIKKKPVNRIDLFFEYSKNMNNRFLKIRKNGRLKNYDF